MLYLKPTVIYLLSLFINMVVLTNQVCSNTMLSFLPYDIIEYIETIVSASYKWELEREILLNLNCNHTIGENSSIYLLKSKEIDSIIQLLHFVDLNFLYLKIVVYQFLVKHYIAFSQGQTILSYQGARLRFFFSSLFAETKRILCSQRRIEKIGFFLFMLDYTDVLAFKRIAYDRFVDYKDASLISDVILHPNDDGRIFSMIF